MNSSEFECCIYCVFSCILIASYVAHSFLEAEVGILGTLPGNLLCNVSCLFKAAS